MKKFLSLLLVVTLVLSCAVLFTSCGEKASVENKNDSSSNTDAAATEGSIDIHGDGVLQMATNAAFPPYEFKEGEEFAGIDVEIAAAIAEKLGMEFEVVDMEFDSIIASVQNGEVDFGMAGMTVNDERKKQVNFTSSYATGVQVVIVAEGSDIATLDDLKGKKIGTQLGTTGDMYSKDDFGEENVVSYSKGADAVIALKGGDVDAVIIDNEPAKVFVAENEGLKLLDTEYAIEDYAIAVSKENTALLDAINAALEELTADGTIDAIISKYISAE